MTTPHKPRHAAPSPPDAGREDEALAGPERPERPEGLEQPEGPERLERPEGLEQPEGPERLERPEGPEGPEGPAGWQAPGPDGPASWATTSAQAEAAASMSGQPGPAIAPPATPAIAAPATPAGAAPAVPADAVPADAVPADAVPADAVPADAALPDATWPDAVRPERIRPERVRPERVRPEQMRPERLQPNAGRRGAPWPDASPPRAAQAGAAGREPEQSRGARLARRGTSTLRLIWVYPDLLSTYGDRGNLLVLERRARLRGIEVEPIEVNSDQPVPRQGDIYLMGGGEDLPQILAARRLRADAGLTAAAGKGAVVFAVCAGYQVIGTEFGGVDGEPVEGLGILNVRSGRGERRGVGEIVADVDPDLGVPRLTGFENHQGVTTLGRGVKPLARVTLGVGNGDGTEGAYARTVLGTYLHGPALVRNPGLADLLLSWAAGPLEPLESTDENWARLLREERLAAVSG